MKKKKSLIILVSIIILVFFIAKAVLHKKPVQQIPPKPVETALSIAKDASIYIESFGNLNPPNDVDIKSQVTGAIKEVCFTQGHEVKKGDPLFIIDPAPYEADLAKAEAALAQDSADLKMKRDTLVRNKKIFDNGLISKQDFDQYETDVAQAEAKVKLDRANIDLAKINLAYCYITSPVDGLTGKRLVDLGNIVTANSGPTLVNIKTIDNLYVDFTIPETRLDEVRQAMKEEKLKVEILVGEEDEEKTYSGILQLLDNTVDNTTGTVALRAVAENKERQLWAGQFVRIRLILGIQKNAVLIPYEAVQLGQNGSYIFVVTSDNKADLRLVKTGNRQKEDIVINEGVRRGERVVTSGQLGLSPGASVVDVTGKKGE